MLPTAYSRLIPKNSRKSFWVEMKLPGLLLVSFFKVEYFHYKLIQNRRLFFSEIKQLLVRETEYILNILTGYILFIEESSVRWTRSKTRKKAANFNTEGTIRRMREGNPHLCQKIAELLKCLAY